MMVGDIKCWAQEARLQKGVLESELGARFANAGGEAGRRYTGVDSYCYSSRRAPVLHDWKAILGLVLFYGLTLVLIRWVILTRRRQPASTVAWILAIVLIPYVGGLLFLFFGINRVERRKMRRRAAKKSMQGKMPMLKVLSLEDEPLKSFPQQVHRMVRLAARLEDTNVTGDNEIEVFNDTNIILRRIEEAILAAKHSIHLDCFGQTDRGLKRPTNEDHFLIADLNKALRIHQTSLNFDDEETIFGASQGMMLLVADGMGGHAAGEHASRLTVESLTSSILNHMPWFFSRDAEGDEDLRTALERALHRCQERLQTEAKAHPSVQGMGTTLTAAYVHWPRTTVIHAGDSRCYLLRAGKLRQITRDHTLAQQIADEGEFRSSNILHTRWANVLWNAIGSGTDDVKPEVHQFDLQLGDVLLLCTDGLPKHVEPQEIRDALERNLDARATCQL
ncbi:hypothetical protein AYO47_10010, partial [Planctomyces sp. SCGC AG-212-M04]